MKDAEQMVPRTRQALDEAVIALEDLVVRLHPSSACFPRKSHMTRLTDFLDRPGLRERDRRVGGVQDGVAAARDGQERPASCLSFVLVLPSPLRRTVRAGLGRVPLSQLYHYPHGLLLLFDTTTRRSLSTFRVAALTCVYVYE